MNEDKAQGQVAEACAYLSRSCSTLVGSEVTTPMHIVRTAACPPTPPLFTVANDGKFDRPESQPGAAPEFLVNFAVALHSSCYY